MMGENSLHTIGNEDGCQVVQPDQRHDSHGNIYAYLRADDCARYRADAAGQGTK
nr:hypothetical protein [Massilia sp. CCM 8734]